MCLLRGWRYRSWTTAHVSDPDNHCDIAASYQVVTSCDSLRESPNLSACGSSPTTKIHCTPPRGKENLKGGARFWRRFWCPANHDSRPVSPSSKPPFARNLPTSSPNPFKRFSCGISANSVWIWRRLENHRSWRLHWSNSLDSSHTPLQATSLSARGLHCPKSTQTFRTSTVQAPLRRIHPL